MTYVCYDVKGIQSFIFKVPQLKHIIGGSAIIDRFDREIVPSLVIDGTELISNAGGKGAFKCATNESANRIEHAIVGKGHEFGLEIRIGRGDTFKVASKTAGKTYSFLPSDFTGHPCEASGLYPTTGKTHSVVKSREGGLQYFEEALQNELKGEEFATGFSFFNNPQTQADVLGNRNRWAIICMDGNDMGAQYRDKEMQSDLQDIDAEWLRKMSVALDECTRKATCAGITEVVTKWREDGGTGNILPVRPLVVGGDDVIVLCHCAYAFDFVRETCRVFNRISKLPGRESFWPATGGEVTISAGVLFAPVTYPLHTAIPYAESLLASAKSAGRKANESKAKTASPSSIDWESVTEGLLDTPAARRHRELRFFDEGAGYGLQLTKRPYLLSDFERLQEKAGCLVTMPASVRASVLPSLRQPLNERLAFYAQIKKNHKPIFDALQEFDRTLSTGWTKTASCNGEDYYETDIIDAFLLLEEKTRMEKPTRGGN